MSLETMTFYDLYELEHFGNFSCFVIKVIINHHTELFHNHKEIEKKFTQYY